MPTHLNETFKNHADSCKLCALSPERQLKETQIDVCKHLKYEAEKSHPIPKDENLIK
jgi:hypothetical protein